MRFIKKMCILRQVKQGFSGDGKTLSGLIKIEQYGNNASVEVSVVNFAPLSSGEYYCIIADEKDRAELLPLRGKSLFNIVTELDIAGGFCGVICFVKNEIVPIAYGVNGNKSYNLRSLVNRIVPDAPSKEAVFSEEEAVFQDEEPKAPPLPQPPEPSEPTRPIARSDVREEKRYDDERLATENYYIAGEDERERIEFEENHRHAHSQSGAQSEIGATGEAVEKNGNAEDVLRTTALETDGYYLSVKSEIDALFARYPIDETLKSTFPHSEWVKIDEEGKHYLVGVIFEELKAKYICYAIPTKNRSEPPEEIKEICVFIPSSLFNDDEGFFVIFQSPQTGECIRPETA